MLIVSIIPREDYEALRHKQIKEGKFVVCRGNPETRIKIPEQALNQYRKHGKKREYESIVATGKAIYRTFAEVPKSGDG